MKSFADFLEESSGTGPAAGRMFSLYGMEIGQFIGIEGMNVIFIHPVNGRMDVPMQSEMPIPIRLKDGELKGPIFNPVLKNILLAD
ncbi:hypothetical protein [Pantoea agglomerans]|uniref:hypothetical protein n=1 Tax=Enterobacter agglomerans TaxID=549 RepID=UPI0013B93706|nr:hypothetical protein [Pantoea agglomerans]NEG58201.1 hypothetical protein [Pantoea agglomerans]NEG99914.1 hypothetical protein [Pantoea agglomerans]NEH04123.1 hypothetical protein [Pantoea agglomerans]NEH14474.1 hypothetical protein [Pantoea agglomerans]